MARVRMDPGKIYDTMVAEGGPQTISRADFIKEVGELTCPHRMRQDLSSMTFERGRQRTLALYNKQKIDKAVN
jgi:hypothetical protein